MKTVAIVLAGGKGSRMNQDVPKQYLPLCGKPVLYYALRAFENSSVDEILIVAGEKDLQYCRTEIVERYHFKKVTRIVPGGTQRYDSVLNGLRALSSRETPVTVLIHDGARPCISQSVIQRCMEDALKYQACVAAVPVKDTVKIADTNGFARRTPDRRSIWQVQTPQAFEFGLIKEAYEKMISDQERGVVTDDAMVVERYTSARVKLTMGAYDNIKITTPEDFMLAEQLLMQRQEGSRGRE